MHIGMIFSTQIPPQEGIGFYTWNLAQELTKKGHRVTMITRGGPHQSKGEVIDGIRIYRPTFVPIYPFHVHFHGIFVNKLLKIIESEIDILHLHTPLVQFPSIDFPTLVTIHTPMKADTASIKPKSLVSILGKLQLPVSVMLEKGLLKNSNLITAVANSVAEELGEYGVERSKVHVLGNGVDTEIFQPKENKPGDHEPVYLLSAGRLGPRKGFEDLFAAALIITEQRKNIEFWIAGSGPFEKKLRTMVDTLGLNLQVKFLGHISNRDQMVDLFQGAACFVHPAHYEGLPTVLLEAMACGSPIVATAISGALDVVKDGKNGLLVPPRDPNALAEKVNFLLDNPSLGEQLGKAAVETINQDFSWSMVGQRYLALYKELVQGKTL